MSILSKLFFLLRLIQKYISLPIGLYLTTPINLVLCSSSSQLPSILRKSLTRSLLPFMMANFNQNHLYVFKKNFLFFFFFVQFTEIERRW